MPENKPGASRREIVGAMAAFPLLAASRGAFAAAGDDPAIRAAFYYAYPLYEFARTEQTLAKCVGAPGKLNQITRRGQLADYRARNVTAPNNDTVYASCFLDLSQGPVEVVSPSIPSRYFSIAFMDAFTDNFAYIGTRATGGRGGRFWVAGPQWQGRVPAGVRLFRSSTNDVWMLGRVLVEGPADLAAAIALLDQIAVVVPEGRAPPRGFTNAGATGVPDPANFLAVVNEILGRSPGGLGQTARARRFRALGIGAPESASQEVLDRWARFFPIGLQDLRDGFLFRDLVVDGWSYQPRGVGNFGDNDRLRAIIALGGIAALGEREAMYFHSTFDRHGERLSGDHGYRWRVPPGGVPAKGFWSLTMYEVDPDGRYFLVQNPIERYSIGDRTPGLVFEPDGSLEIVIQHAPPTGRLAPNWLPAPSGPMRLALRAYLPQDALLDRKWRLPPLERVEGM